MANNFARSTPAPNASNCDTRSHSDLCQNLRPITLSSHFRHSGIRTHRCSCGHAMHCMALCKCLWPSIPLLSDVCRLGPQLDLLRQVQECSGNVLWSLNLKYATGHNNPMLANPAHLGTSSFAGEKVWALWNIFSGWFVSLGLPIAVCDNKFGKKTSFVCKG